MLVRCRRDFCRRRRDPGDQAPQVVARAAREPCTGGNGDHDGNRQAHQRNLHYRRDLFSRPGLEFNLDLLFAVEELGREPIEIPEGFFAPGGLEFLQAFFQLTRTHAFELPSCGFRDVSRSVGKALERRNLRWIPNQLAQFVQRRVNTGLGFDKRCRVCILDAQQRAARSTLKLGHMQLQAHALLHD